MIKLWMSHFMLAIKSIHQNILSFSFDFFLFLLKNIGKKSKFLNQKKLLNWSVVIVAENNKIDLKKEQFFWISLTFANTLFMLFMLSQQNLFDKFSYT